MGSAVGSMLCHKVQPGLTLLLFVFIQQNSWTGSMEVIGYESYDSQQAIESLSSFGFWIDSMHVECRTGVDLGLPPNALATRSTRRATWPSTIWCSSASA